MGGVPITLIKKFEMEVNNGLFCWFILSHITCGRLKWTLGQSFLHTYRWASDDLFMGTTYEALQHFYFFITEEILSDSVYFR